MVSSMLPTIYNFGNQIVQAPGYLVIRNKMIHEARIIPLDGRAHVGSQIKTLHGRFTRLAMTAYNIIQPLTRSKFISSLGAANLRYVILVPLFLIGILMLGYTRLYGACLGAGHCRRARLNFLHSGPFLTHA
jgi:hypothetical protein